VAVEHVSPGRPPDLHWATAILERGWIDRKCRRVCPPAFVERCWWMMPAFVRGLMSPGSVPRPSSRIDRYHSPP